MLRMLHLPVFSQWSWTCTSSLVVFGFCFKLAATHGDRYTCIVKQIHGHYYGSHGSYGILQLSSYEFAQYTKTERSICILIRGNFRIKMWKIMSQTLSKQRTMWGLTHTVFIGSVSELFITGTRKALLSGLHSEDAAREGKLRLSKL